MIRIMEECDGFEIRIENSMGTESYRFNQEDSIQGLVKLFEDLGFEAEYEEVY